MVFPLSLCQRHPRYALFISGLIFIAFFLLSSNSDYSLHPTSRTSGLPPDPSLPGRVARAEEIYKDMLDQRQELIRKFGPTPAQVVMYVVFSISFCHSPGRAQAGRPSAGSRRTKNRGPHTQSVSPRLIWLSYLVSRPSAVLGETHRATPNSNSIQVPRRSHHCSAIKIKNP